MATRPKQDLRATTRHVIEASREIVFDHLFLTKTLMHAIRNNLPVELAAAQIDPIDEPALEKDDSIEVISTVAADLSCIETGHEAMRRPHVALVSMFVLAALLVAGFVAYALTIEAEKAEATSKASSGVHAALAIDLDTPEAALDIAQKRWDRGDAAGAIVVLEPLWERRVQTSVTAPLMARAHLAAGDFEESRAVARSVLAEDPDNDSMREIFNQAIISDPAFEARWVELSLDDFDRVESSADGRFVIERDGASFELIVSTAKRPDDWEDPIAAWRLCMAIDCVFGLSRAVPARVDLQSLALHASFESDQSEFVVDDDGWVRASLVDASARNFVRFPIERTREWRALLDASSQLEDRPATEVLAEWKKSEKKLWKHFEPEMRELGSVSLSRQLSSMLVFDYLANNWNRFHWRDHGRAMRIKDGELWAMGHAGAFKTRSSKRVSGRFGWTERLGQNDVAAAAALDLDRVGGQIFVGGTRVSLEKLKTMKRQQRRLVERVERLEERWGSERVFAFRSR